MLQNIAECKINYKLPKRIYNNTFVDVWEELLKEKGLMKDYKIAQESILSFINASIESGLINKDDINRSLKKALLFDKQKDIQIYNLNIDKIYDKDEILRLINKRFNIDKIPYNNLADTYSINIDEYEDIGYVEILEENSNGKVEKLRLIFAKQMKYSTKEESDVLDNSYFPIDIDFKSKRMIVKYYNKNHLKGDLRGEGIAYKYANDIIDIFNIELGNSEQTLYQRGLYNICNHILNNVINEKSNLILENIEELVNDFSKNIKEKLLPNVDTDRLLQEYERDVFNVNKQINKLIENICISKVIHEANDRNIMSVDGIISHITYKEAGNVKATLQKPSKIQNLVDSQSYLNLRTVLDEKKFIQEIKMIWNTGDIHISLRYDASKKEYISIKFYRKYGDEDLTYAMQKWEEFCKITR